MVSKQKDGSLWLSIYIQPGASKSEVVGPHGDALKIRINAPPVDGKANSAIIKFIAEKLGISKISIQIVKGETQRNKVIRIEGAEEDLLKSRLLKKSTKDGSF